MKKIMAVILSLALCFAFVSCGENKAGDAEQNEQETDDLYADSDYDFGLEMTDEFSLSSVLKKCEYTDLIEREDEFKELLRKGLSDSGLSEFEVEDVSLKEELDHAMTELQADGNPVSDDLIEAYRNIVFVSARESISEDDWDGAAIQIGIMPSSEDIEEAEEPDDVAAALLNGKYMHAAEYTGRTYHDPEAADCKKICEEIQNLTGIKADPEKLKEAFSEAIETARTEDKIADLTQEITVEGDGYTDNAYVTVSAYVDEEELSFGIESCGRSRIYE